MVYNKEEDLHKVLEGELDGFIFLGNAIADGTELDNDLLDKIFEGMEKKEASKDEIKGKKKKVKKVSLTN